MKCLYCTLPSSSPKGRSVFIHSSHFFHQGLLLSLLHWTQIDSARMDFKHPKTYSKFHVHIEENIRCLGWALIGERKGAVGHQAGWIWFPDSDRFFFYFFLWSLTLNVPQQSFPVCMGGSTYTHPFAQMTNNRSWRENIASSFHKPEKRGVQGGLFQLE